MKLRGHALVLKCWWYMNMPCLMTVQKLVLLFFQCKEAGMSPAFLDGR